MAIPKKIKALEDVAEPFRAEYKKVGEEFVLDVSGEEDLSQLKNANERLKVDREELRDRLKTTEQTHSEYKSKVDNIPALEKGWEKKVTAEKVAGEAKAALLTKALHKATVGEEATKLSVISITPKVLKPLIEARLTMELGDDGVPKTRVLDKDGKLSAMTLEELQKEFADDPELAPIIIGSRASGGGTTQLPTGDAGKPSVLNTTQQALAGLTIG